MADFASLQFEMERRSILFTANTTMPDNSLLGFEGNPNSIVSPSTAGQTLIYNSPRGTNYLQLSNGTLWFKNASPNTWVAVADAQLSGYINNTFATISNLALTGQSLNEKINNLSGVSVLTYGDQTINGTKYFNDSVYIHDLYVTGTEFIANVQNNFVESPYILLNLTGGAIDGGIFFVTGAGLTGISDYGPIIGFDHSNKFKFGTARRSDDLSTLNDIAAVQDITNYSGFVNNNFYPRNNPSGFITGIDLSPYVTKSGGQFLNRPTVNGTGVLLSGEAAGSANFRYFPTSGVFNLLSNNRYSFDTFSGLVTGILPANPQKGDEVELYDSAGTWHINPLIVDNNGNYIEQKKDMLECNVRHGLIKLIYTTQNNIGWRIYPMPIHNVPLFLPPSIAITGYSLSGIIPFNIALTGISLLDPLQAPVDEWYWNLNTGDGYAVSGQTIAYTYLQTGLYDVTLSGSNAAGFDVEHRFINVFLPYVPTVSVTSNKLSGLAPFTGQLSATNTTQPAEYSPVDDWYWDFDGDQVFDFTGQNATVVYNQTGTYNPTAYAVNLGGTGSGFITINVIEPLVPIPAIATYTASGYAPLTIQFSGVNLQTPEEFSPVDHWYWNLSGDSAPEFDQRVISYTFNETGTYTFYLTAANSAGSGVASGIVTVLEISSDEYSDYVSLLLHFDN